MSSSGKQVGYVVRDEGICGGQPRIAGTRLEVQTIALEYESLGWTPDRICDSHPGITLAQIHAALTYYYDHRVDIDLAVQEDQELAERLRPELMPLALLCDEHIPYPGIEGLRRRALDVTTVQQLDMRGALDQAILQTAHQQGRVIYTSDVDFLRHHAMGIGHSGIIYHHTLDYSVGEAIRRVSNACETRSAEEMMGRVVFL